MLTRYYLVHTSYYLFFFHFNFFFLPSPFSGSVDYKCLFFSTAVFQLSHRLVSVRDPRVGNHCFNFSICDLPMVHHAVAQRQLDAFKKYYDIQSTSNFRSGKITRLVLELHNRYDIVGWTDDFAITSHWSISNYSGFVSCFLYMQITPGAASCSEASSLVIHQTSDPDHDVTPAQALLLNTQISSPTWAGTAKLFPPL